MLNNLSEQIRDCLHRAEDCAQKAAAQTDQKLKQGFLDNERRWLMLAQSYDFTQRLGDFSDEAKLKADDLNSGGQRAAPITPLLQDRAFDPETAQAVANALVMTCEALGLSNRDDAMTQLVAEKIMELAKRGLKNPTELHLAAIKEFNSNTQEPPKPAQPSI
jgi:hypothetical protein